MIAALLPIRSSLAAEYALELEAPSGCAGREKLVAAIRAVSPAFTPADAWAPGLVRFVVRFLPNDQQLMVELETLQPDGTSFVRRLPAHDCDEALQASAWILTLLMDESARDQGPSEADAQKPRTPPGSNPTVEATSNASRNRNEPARPPTPTGTGTERWRPALGVVAGVLGTALPQTPFGYGAFAELAWNRDSLVTPALRLSWLTAGSGVNRVERGQVEIALSTVRAAACPLRSPQQLPYRARFCGLFETGWLTGTGHRTDSGSSAQPTWYAAGASIGGEVLPMKSLAIDFEAGLLFPFNRDRFVFQPEPIEVGYEVPRTSASLALGLAYHF